MITEEWILAKSREMLEDVWPIKKMHIASHPMGAKNGFSITASDEFGGVYCTLEDSGRDKLSQDQFALYYLEPLVMQMKNQLEFNKEKMLKPAPSISEATASLAEAPESPLNQHP